MTFFKWLNMKVKKLDWYDISLIKFSSIAAVLLLAKYYPILLSLEWYWYGLVIIVGSLLLLRKIYGKG